MVVEEGVALLSLAVWCEALGAKVVMQHTATHGTGRVTLVGMRERSGMVRSALGVRLEFSASRPFSKVSLLLN